MREGDTDLVRRMHVRLVGPIKQLIISVIQICKDRDHPPQQISSKEKDSRNTPCIEVLYYFFVMLHQALHKMLQYLIGWSMHETRKCRAVHVKLFLMS